MKDYNSSVFDSDQARQLALALSLMNNQKDVQSFLANVMTKSEIKEVSSRLQAAKMLQAKEKYLDIQSSTGLSSATVARISNWLTKGSGGYKTALSLVDQHHEHI